MSVKSTRAGGTSLNTLSREISLVFLVYVAFFFISAYYLVIRLDHCDSSASSSTGGSEAVASGAEASLRRTASQQSASRVSLPGGQAAEGNLAQLSHPLAHMMRTFVHPDAQHDPTQRRDCFTFTAIPKEIPQLQQIVNKILKTYPRYANFFDCVHVSIPERSIRFSGDPYPTTPELMKIFDDPRIILHRFFDYGPMTRYIGPLSYERHPDTTLLLFDIDSENMFDHDHTDMVNLVEASRHVDTDSLWCVLGENIYVNSEYVARPAWDTFPLQKTAAGDAYNRVHFCRGAQGILYKPKHFVDFWYNQTEYHESCFWDDDRWVAFQMERQGFKLHKLQKITSQIELQRKQKLFSSSSSSLHRPGIALGGDRDHGRRLGTLTQVHYGMKSDQTCTIAYLKAHPQFMRTVYVERVSE